VAKVSFRFWIATMEVQLIHVSCCVIDTQYPRLLGSDTMFRG